MDQDVSLVHKRNVLIIKLLFSFYLLQMLANVFVFGFSVLYPPVGFILCGIIALLIWKQFLPRLMRYVIVLLTFAYFFYLINDFPYLVNYMFMWFGLILSSLYQSYRIIISAGLLSILLTVYSFSTFHEEIFLGVEKIDLVFFIMFGVFLTVFLLFYNKLTSMLSIEAEKSKEKLNFILESTNIVTFNYDLKSKRMNVSSGLQQFPSFPKKYSSDSPILWENNIHPEDLAIMENVTTSVYLGKKQDVEFRLVDENEKIIWVYCHYIPIIGIENSLQSIEGVYIDVTERKHAEEKVKYLAYHDYLTGLPNRSQLCDYFSKLKKKRKSTIEEIFLIFIDLDSFKPVNDRFGHDVGDQLLKIVAKRLTYCLRESDLVARVGGDEFVAILKDVSVETVAEVAERIKESLATPFTIADHQISITPSIGISKHSSDDESLEDMLKKADIAMYDVKKCGKNDFRFYGGV